jgi:hypothetical protein
MRHFVLKIPIIRANGQTYGLKQQLQIRAPGGG